MIYPVAAILPGRRPIRGAVSACSPRPMFRRVRFPGFSLWISPEPITLRFDWRPPPSGETAIHQHRFSVSISGRCSAVSSSMALFPRLLRNPQPSVSTGGRHPYREAANHQRGLRLQSPADVPRSPDPRPFSQLSQNPQPRISAGDRYPSGKTANLWHWFPVAVPGQCSTVSDSLVFLCGFPQNPEPSVSTGGRHPSGKTANQRHRFSVLISGRFSAVSSSLALFPGLIRNPQPRVPTRSRHPYGETANPRHWFLVSVPGRFSAVSGSPAFPESTTSHLDRRPPLLLGDGQSLARFPVAVPG